ncbi:MAG: hypothetical protein GY754_32085 [bacterium]|nr:hypothetical protein [bacterium]
MIIHRKIKSILLLSSFIFSIIGCESITIKNDTDAKTLFIILTNKKLIQQTGEKSLVEYNYKIRNIEKDNSLYSFHVSWEKKPVKGTLSELFFTIETGNKIFKIKKDLYNKYFSHTDITAAIHKAHNKLYIQSPHKLKKHKLFVVNKNRSLLIEVLDNDNKDLYNFNIYKVSFKKDLQLKKIDIDTMSYDITDKKISAFNIINH